MFADAKQSKRCDSRKLSGFHNRWQGFATWGWPELACSLDSRKYQ